MNIKHPYPKQIFVFGSDTTLGDTIAKLLKERPATHETKLFPDGERMPHQLETVRGRDVFVIFTSQCGGNIDYWLMDYLRFIRAIKARGPHKITVVLPKLPHQRQDVENLEDREPPMVSFFPDLLKAAGADHLVVCKLHNPASRTENPPMENADTTPLIIHEIKKRFPNLSEVAIATGDMGGAKYCRKIANKLGTPIIIADKERDLKNGNTTVMKVYTYGTISDKIKDVVFVDDLISTFGTLRKAADAVYKEHPRIKNFYAAATHADFGDETLENMTESKFKEIWVTDTVPVPKTFIEAVKKSGKKLCVISVSRLLAQIVDNLHNSDSVSDLWTRA